MRRERRLSKIEKEYIKGALKRSSQKAHAFTLYRKRLRRLLADLLSLKALEKRGYEDLKLNLVDIYKCLTLERKSSGSTRAANDIEKLETLQLLLEELMDLIVNNASRRAIKQIIDEAKEIIC